MHLRGYDKTDKSPLRANLTRQITKFDTIESPVELKGKVVDNDQMVKKKKKTKKALNLTHAENSPSREVLHKHHLSTNDSIGKELIFDDKIDDMLQLSEGIPRPDLSKNEKYNLLIL